MANTNIKKLGLIMGGVSLLFIIIFFYFKADRGYINADNPCLEGYYVYPLDRGYGPGSILTAERSFWNKNKIRISSLQFSSERLKNKLIDDDILAVEANGSLSDCNSFNYDEFDTRILFKSRDLELPDIEINPVLKSFKDVKINVENGKRYSLKGGESGAFQDLITQLPATDLENILRELERGFELYFVSEVAVYDEATVSIVWKDSLSEMGRTDLLSSIRLSGNYEWTSANNLNVKFAEGSNVGFVGRFINEQDKEFIRNSLETRIKEGDLVLLFEDKDEDGFGSNFDGQSRLFGSKQVMERNIGEKVIRYVKNNLDTDDNNDNRGPGEKEWYRDLDGDGYGDAGSVIIGINCPAGYVSNSQDCYDNNANAFPGQTAYFQNHRGDGSFDYDCQGGSQLQFTNVGGCVNSCRALRSGWISGIPPCGESAGYVTGCDNGNWTNRNCTVHTEQRVQFCH